MLIKTKRTPEEQKKYFTILGAAAQLALVLGIILGRMDIPHLDFLIGMLYGFSMVGNLAYIYMITRAHRRNQDD